MVFGEFQDGQFEGMSVKEIRTHKLECRLREFDIEGEYNAIRHSKKGGGKFANIDRKKVEVILLCVRLFECPCQKGFQLLQVTMWLVVAFLASALLNGRG